MQEGTHCQVVCTSHVIGSKLLTRLYTTWATICGHHRPSYVHANGVDAPNFIDCAGATVIAYPGINIRDIPVDSMR